VVCFVVSIWIFKKVCAVLYIMVFAKVNIILALRFTMASIPNEKEELISDHQLWYVFFKIY
jgi:hypothetical protein